VEAEFELNSIIPPPDTIEEEKKKKRKGVLKANNLKKSRVTLKSTQSVK
jgi:hypothetical protein